ncbi:dipeptide ABC transporter ATP-binding protein [Pseudomonas sp. NPDC007930]|uniref:dipeptide ABC transporter ATP-binding protein n=1 Tax=Pseudomonas sp. NPDC007930 TaxID=3364417 RepID=UPI0036E72C92
MSHAIVTARNLTIGFGHGAQLRQVVHGVDLSLYSGQCLALVGESGSGKSVIAKSLVGLLGEQAQVSAAELQLAGHNLLALRGRAWRRLRGEQAGFVLQDALVSLDPLRSIGAEVGDLFRLHRPQLSAAQRREQVLAVLAEAGISDPEQRIDLRAPQLSGGLRQRALIAAAVALRPPVLIADEPTTALDASVQAQVLALLRRLADQGTALLLISHDLAAVAQVADHIAVMHSGRLVEQGLAAQVLHQPRSAYTRQLLAAVPRPERKGQRLGNAAPVALQALAQARPGPAKAGAALSVQGLSKRFALPQQAPRQALAEVSFELAAGTTLGIVGESGSGKTSLANIILGLLQPDAGQVLLNGQPWAAPGLSEAQRRPRRAEVGVVFQDPLGSFDPRWSVAQVLTDALLLGQRRAPRTVLPQLHALLDAVGLPQALLARSPRWLSGGQRQRVAIARALAHAPSLLVFDEAVSALDVSIQAQILDLLGQIQRELKVSCLFISHDLDVVHHVSDQVLVMKDGRVVEHGSAERVLLRPQAAYTQALVAAARAGQGHRAPEVLRVAT